MSNAHLIEKLIAAAGAIDVLNEMNISIIDVDINRRTPVLKVLHCAAVKRLNGVRFAYRGGPCGRINCVQAPLNNCRVEWEIQ